MLEGRANSVGVWDGDLPPGYSNDMCTEYYIVYLCIYVADMRAQHWSKLLRRAS